MTRWNRATDIQKAAATAIERQYHKELGIFSNEPFEPWTMLSFAKAALRAADKERLKAFNAGKTARWAHIDVPIEMTLGRKAKRKK